jgi:hypothetical protein
MDDASSHYDTVYTLLCVRADGVASVVDLVASEDLRDVRRRAEALLREHRSSVQVEIWRGGSLVDQVARAPEPQL